MGFRKAVEIASAILWALLDFPPEVKVTTHIDNARFCGPSAATTQAILTFVERCQK